MSEEEVIMLMSGEDQRGELAGLTLYEVLFGLKNTAYETRTKLFFPTISLTGEHNLFIEYVCFIGTVRN